MRLAYFYFSFNDLAAQEPLNILRCLTRQILSTFERVPTAAETLYKTFLKNQPVPSYQSCSSIFLQLCSQHDNIAIVIDALDECDAKLYRRKTLKFLKDLMAANVKLFITSRPYAGEIMSLFTGYPQVVINASETDLRSYLIEKIDERREESKEMRDMVSDEFGETIISTLVTKAQGMQVDVPLPLPFRPCANSRVS